jgi:hypothetical protein
MPLINLKPGTQFGRLTVVKRVGTHGSQATWLCRCECGKEKVLQSQNLRRTVRSCGCLRFGHVGYNQLSLGEYAFNVVLKGYKKGASKRGLEFLLSVDTVKHIMGSPCDYCGRHLKSYTHPKNANGGFKYNGIDRVVNSVGYTLENCVPCCSDCNRAKSTLSRQEFTAWARRVKEHLNL